MYGPAAYPPEPPRPAGAVIGRVVLRTVLAAVALLSLGILAWVPLLALAVTTRRARDWAVCALGMPLVLGTLVLAGWTDDDDDWQTIGGFCLLAVLALAATAYYLAGDVRHVARRRLPAAGNPYMTATPVYAFGPGPAVPAPVAGFGPVPPPFPAPATPPAPPAPAVTGPAPGSVPVPPARPDGGRRMDEVRAGLDELSAYLREQEGPAS